MRRRPRRQRPAPPPAAGDEEPPLLTAPIPPHRRDPDAFRNRPRRNRDGTIATGFDGLALPPVRQIDVFSQMSPPSEVDETEPAAAEDAAGIEPAEALVGEVLPPPDTPATDVFEPLPDTLLAEQTQRDAELPALPGKLQVRPELPGTVEGELLEPPKRDVKYAAELTEAEAAEVRRRYFRRVSALVVRHDAADRNHRAGRVQLPGCADHDRSQCHVQEHGRVDAA